MLFLFLRLRVYYYRYHNQILQAYRSCQVLQMTTWHFCSISYWWGTKSFGRSSCSDDPVVSSKMPFRLVFDRFEKFKKLELFTWWDQLDGILEFDLDLDRDLENEKMTVNSLLYIVEGRVIAYLKGLEVGILKIDIDLHHDLDQCISHDSLSRPDLVLVTRSTSSSYSTHVFSGMVSRTDMVQVSLEPPCDLVVRKFYRPAKFAFVRPQRSKNR